MFRYEIIFDDPKATRRFKEEFAIYTSGGWMSWGDTLLEFIGGSYLVEMIQKFQGVASVEVIDTGAAVAW